MFTKCNDGLGWGILALQLNGFNAVFLGGDRDSKAELKQSRSHTPIASSRDSFQFAIARRN
ncbi:hypothetical protein [Rubidibacter lacunae]|uniref:hypothetical protein n=1 Tax=Rubidibacter lacunae TaxID=582514 RepID=UPI0003F82F84|nr:hypothetical protein [Rubidibacter lacunae]